MSKRLEKKTNAMRELERAGQPYAVHELAGAQGLSGLELANAAGQDPSRVFKTLVAMGKSGRHYVFMIPVSCELDLKKAAAVVGEKSVRMIPQRDLLGLTGYVHGGCSPLGMKRRLDTTIDATAQLFDTVYFSGGRVGCQIEAAVGALAACIPLRISALV